MPRNCRAILFDAGNTILFPRVDVLADELQREGYSVTVADFYAAERDGKRILDEWLWPLLRDGKAPPKADYYYWTEYLKALVRRLDIPEDKQQQAGLRLAERFKEINTWSRIFPDAREYLCALRDRGYVLGVVSNSMGLIEHQLIEVGLAPCFSFILDSHYVGFEKPHPEIFRLALERTGCAPSEALFVGDLYSTDIGGAQNAGLEGVLMDWVGAYPDAPVPRITSLPELDQTLSR